ncbi:MAG: MFS transporter [Sphingomonas sp.]|uniref:MFS transporter n=1 Tax=Sphingomonas sp. TaxID=28214 RepID=UPI0025F17B6F|nr:MFS transporter [Sphingomonas sp.]MBX3564175.1 MFS transporter [Sphingomonas sp.]
MQAFDTNAVTVALPAMARAFRVQPLALDMVISAYLIGAAGFLPLCNWAAERFGARVMFLLAIAMFGASSLMCGLAADLPGLILARVVQGGAGALLLPVGRIIVLSATPRQDFVRAMAVLTTPVMVGPLVGPPLGGAIVTLVSWRWLFLVNLPIALIGLVLVIRFLPAMPADRKKPLDWLGLALLSTALVAISYGLTLPMRGASPVAIVAIPLIGLASGLFYLRHASRHPRPILDPAVLRIPTVAIATIGGIFQRMLTSAAPFLLALLFQLGLGLSPLAAGSLIFGSALGSVCARWPLGWMLRRWGFRRMLTANALAIAATLSASALFTPATPYALLFALLFVQGLLRSLQITAISTLVYADLAERDIGAASTLSSLVQQLALACGIALSAAAVQALLWWHGGTVLGADAIRPAFVLLAITSLLSLAWILRLPGDAGNVIADRHDVATRSPDRAIVR